MLCAGLIMFKKPKKNVCRKIKEMKLHTHRFEFSCGHFSYNKISYQNKIKTVLHQPEICLWNHVSSFIWNFDIKTLEKTVKSTISSVIPLRRSWISVCLFSDRKQRNEVSVPGTHLVEELLSTFFQLLCISMLVLGGSNWWVSSFSKSPFFWYSPL